MQETEVQSLVRELRSHMLQAMARKKKNIFLNALYLKNTILTTHPYNILEQYQIALGCFN